MKKKDLTKNLIDEVSSKPAKKNYETNKIIYNHIDERWSIDLAGFSDYKLSYNKGFRNIFNIIDKFSEYSWAILLKNKNVETKTNEFSNVLTKTRRKPLKIESERGAEFYIMFFFRNSSTKKTYNIIQDSQIKVLQ